MAQEESSAAFAILAEELEIEEALMASTITSQMEKSASPSSPPSRSSCESCRERRENDQMFKIESCIHSFCSDCINKHVATKIQGGIITPVTCPDPDCKSVQNKSIIDFSGLDCCLKKKNHRMHLVGDDIPGADVSFVIDVEQNGLTTTVGAQEKEQIDRTANLSTDIYLKLNLFKEYIS
ncbi:hypothetical protein KPL70_021114 [Citrus sinensis]|nr:hypothetical protein KPL70_021114 [Citrus sinensis]